jgi:3-hydroxyisobutyrate dehydrogenase
MMKLPSFMRRRQARRLIGAASQCLLCQTADMATHQVGLIGLGVLGTPIAERLLSAGMQLSVYDVRAQAMSAALAAGASGKASPAEVAAASELTFVCVRTDEQCVDAITGPAGVLAGAKDGHVVVVLSTVDPATAISLAAKTDLRRTAFVEAPLAGTGPDGVRAGTMWALAGGDPAAIATAEPILAKFCERVVHTGPVGSGSAVKLAHNVMIYLGYLATVEAAGLARVSGVRDGVLAEVTRATGALSRQSDIFLEIHNRRGALGAGDADPDADYFQGASALLAKDLGHAVELARRGGLELPGCELTRVLGDAIYQVRSDLPADQEPAG